MPALPLPPRRPRMIATDLDGTIIGYRHTRSGLLSPRTIAALNIVMLHDDLADPASDDPVSRRSSRPQAVATIGGQHEQRDDDGEGPDFGRDRPGREIPQIQINDAHALEHRQAEQEVLEVEE